MSFKKLIINADDLGADPARNRGILEAHARGIVTDASLLVNSSGFDDAIKGIKASRLPTGLHFNISEGRPAGGPFKTLTGPNGEFHGKDETWRRAIAGALDPAEIRAEAEAQVGKMRQAGVEPTHLDGHQHLHLVPRIAAGLIALPISRRVRLAFEHPDGTVLSGPDKATFLNRFREMTQASRPLWEAAGWRWPGAFFGAGMIGAVNSATILRVLDLVATGVTELLVHPGYPDLQSLPFSTHDREIELEALLDPRVREGISARGIDLTTWNHI